MLSDHTNDNPSKEKRLRRLFTYGNDAPFLIACVSLGCGSGNYEKRNRDPGPPNMNHEHHFLKSVELKVFQKFTFVNEFGPNSQILVSAREHSTDQKGHRKMHLPHTRSPESESRSWRETWDEMRWDELRSIRELCRPRWIKEDNVHNSSFH